MRRSKAGYFIELLIHALFWLAVYYALKAITASALQMLINDNGRIMSQNGRLLFPYAWIVLCFLMLLFYSNSFWLFKKTIRYRSNFRRVAVIGGWMSGLYILNYFLIRLLTGPAGNVPIPPGKVMPRFPVATSGFSDADWLNMQPIIALLFILVLGVAVAYFFIKEWIRNELARSQAAAHQLSTELRFLRSQVNPHFLFNTLNNLFSMAQEKGNDELADGISKLSGMMRYMIYDSNAGTVPLKKEIEYLQDCITLNKLRYADDEVKVIFDHPVQAGSVTIAPMIFIPFVENAFKHGVAISQHSKIDIVIRVSNERLIFTCVNNKYNAIKKMENEKTGIGLDNVKRRLDLLYPGKHTLQIIDGDERYIVKLEIELQ